MGYEIYRIQVELFANQEIVEIVVGFKQNA